MLIPLQGNYKTGRQWRIVLSRYFRVKPVIAIYDMQGYYYMEQNESFIYPTVYSNIMEIIK